MTCVMRRFWIAVVAVAALVTSGDQVLAAISHALNPGVIALNDDAYTPVAGSGDYAAYYNVYGAANSDNADGTTAGKSGFGRSLRGLTADGGKGRYFGQSFANPQTKALDSVTLQLRLGSTGLAESGTASGFQYRFRVWEDPTAAVDFASAVTRANSYPARDTDLGASNTTADPEAIFAHGLSVSDVVAEYDFTLTETDVNAALENIDSQVNVLANQPGGSGGIHESFRALTLTMSFSGTPLVLQKDRTYFISLNGTHAENARPFDAWMKNDAANQLFPNGVSYESDGGVGAIGSARSWGFAVKYSDAPAIMPGDFDADGDVDGQDFLAWQRGESPNGTPGGPVSAADLDEWKVNFGVVPPAIASSAAVPEPTGMLLCVSAAVGFIASNSKRRTCCTLSRGC